MRVQEGGSCAGVATYLKQQATGPVAGTLPNHRADREGDISGGHARQTQEV